jgi:hypothetical protein
MTDLTDATKQRLLAGTALEFLGLDESRFSVAVTTQGMNRRAAQRRRCRSRNDPFLALYSDRIDPTQVADPPRSLAGSVPHTVSESTGRAFMLHRLNRAVDRA